MATEAQSVGSQKISEASRASFSIVTSGPVGK